MCCVKSFLDQVEKDAKAGNPDALNQFGYVMKVVYIRDGRELCATRETVTRAGSKRTQVVLEEHYP